MKLKTIIGILLIVLSIAAMFFWESKGREMITTTSILVCSDTIHKGEAVEISDMKIMKISKDSVLEGALMPQDAESLEGTVANVEIVENQQLLSSYFSMARNTFGADQSIYVIPKEWIFSRSSALRKGDTVSIYKMPEKEKLGTYSVAFVRDSSEQEVCDIEPGARTVLDRKDSGRIISGIEIICTLDDYSKLYESVLVPVSVNDEAEEDQSNIAADDSVDTESLNDSEDSSTENTETEIMASLLIVMEDAI